MNELNHSQPMCVSPSAESCAPTPTPTHDPALAGQPADFASLAGALDHAAVGRTGLNFHDDRGRLAGVLSYVQLRHRARAVGRGLLAQGLRRGDRVAIVAETAPSFAVSFFACQYAGLHAVPVPARSGLGTAESYIEDLRQLLANAGARIVLGPQSELAPLENAASGLPIERVTTVDTIEAEGESDGAGHTLHPLGPAELSHIQYSSGSTREPHGIRITQRGLMANARCVVTDGLAISTGDRAVSWLPFYHDMGLVGFLIMPVTCQMSVDYMAPETFARRPGLWLELISANRGTVAFSPSFGYELCSRRVRQLDGLDLSSWRIAGVGGERVRPDTLDAFAQRFAPAGFQTVAFTPSYGLAEATLAVSFHALDRKPAVDAVDRTVLMHDDRARPAEPGPARRASRFVSCGRPLPGHEVQIRDAGGRPLGARSVGRIFVAGPSLMLGYVDGAAAELTADGWLDTGDLGYLVDGELYVTGRQKELIIVNGRNVLPQDLEWIARQAVDGLSDRDTAAFAVLDEAEREVPVLLVQVRTRKPQTRQRLRHRIHAALFQGAGINCHVVLVRPRTLPFTSSGKLSRTKARELYLSGTLNMDATHGPVVSAGG